MINIVVTGYGMGAEHARLIKKVDGLNLYGVCDIQERKRKIAEEQHPGIKTYECFDQVLADKDVDLISVVLPHDLHASYAIQAMDAGKHCLTDKPICLTVKELRAMIAARDRNKRMLSTFHNRRWDRDFVTIRKLLKENVIGEPYHIDMACTDYGESRPTTDTLRGWRGIRSRMGGWMFDWGAHFLDQLYQLTRQRPVKVYAFAHYNERCRKEVEDMVNAIFTLENGMTAEVCVSYMHRAKLPRWRIIGRDGAIEQEWFDTPIKVTKEIGGINSHITVPLLPSDWVGFYQNVAGVLRNDAELEVKPEDLFPMVAAAEATYKSIETGQAVNVEY